MLVRNLRKAGDYERAILSQEENLRMAIANDRSIAQARSQFSKGMIPELTPQQMRSREEILTDAIAIAAKAQENLLTLYPKETVQKFMAGLTQENMTYLNVYWNDLKPILKNKTGLNKTFFDRILRQHIQGIVDSRGMSTVPTTGVKSVSINEPAEIARLGFDWMLKRGVLQAVASKLDGIAKGTAKGSKPRIVLNQLMEFIKALPKPEVLAKAKLLPEGERGKWFNELANQFIGTDSDQSNWDTLYVKDGRDFVDDVTRHHTVIDEPTKEILEKLYNFIPI